MKPTTRVRRAIVTGLTGVAVCALVFVSGWFVSELEPPAKPKTTQGDSFDVDLPGTDDDIEVTYAGVQVAIDLATGRMRQPSEAEAAQLAQGMRTMFQSGPEPSLTYHDDGGVSVELGMRGCKLTVLTRNEDGGLSRACVSGAAQAQLFIEQAKRDEGVR